MNGQAGLGGWDTKMVDSSIKWWIMVNIVIK